MEQKQESREKRSVVETESDGGQSIFNVLNPSYSIDEMEIREDSQGTVYVQDPDGTVAEVKQQVNGLRAEEVEPDTVNLDGMDEVEDVFGGQVMAE